MADFDVTYERDMAEIDEGRMEKLASLSRAQEFCSELVEDNYLWTDASAAYCRRILQTLMAQLGVKAVK